MSRYAGVADNVALGINQLGAFKHPSRVNSLLTPHVEVREPERVVHTGVVCSCSQGWYKPPQQPQGWAAAPCAPAWCPAMHPRVPGDRGQQSWDLLMTPICIHPVVLVHTGSSRGMSTSLDTLGFLKLEEVTQAGREPWRRAWPQPLGHCAAPGAAAWRFWERAGTGSPPVPWLSHGDFPSCRSLTSCLRQRKYKPRPSAWDCSAPTAWWDLPGGRAQANAGRGVV